MKVARGNQLARRREDDQAHAGQERARRSSLRSCAPASPTAGAASGAALARGNAAYGIACRFFRGFDRIPGAWLPALDEHAHLFAPTGGPLSLREREILARGVAGDDDAGFGSAGSGVARATARGSQDLGAPLPPPNGMLRRGHALRTFARAWRGREELCLTDVERLLEAGFGRTEIRAAVRACLAYSFAGRLCAAAAIWPAAADGAGLEVAPRAAAPEHAPAPRRAASR